MQRPAGAIPELEIAMHALRLVALIAVFAIPLAGLAMIGKPLEHSVARPLSVGAGAPWNQTHAGSVATQ